MSLSWAQATLVGQLVFNNKERTLSAYLLCSEETAARKATKFGTKVSLYT